jgi:hypothetical protein
VAKHKLIKLNSLVESPVRTYANINKIKINQIDAFSSSNVMVLEVKENGRAQTEMEA